MSIEGDASNSRAPAERNVYSKAGLKIRVIWLRQSSASFM